jgi:hypothetical protein
MTEGGNRQERKKKEQKAASRKEEKEAKAEPVPEKGTDIDGGV